MVEASENSLLPGPIDEATSKGIRHSLNLSIWEGASYSVMVGFAEIYFIPLLIALNATDFQVGFFVAMIQIFLGFSQFGGLQLVERFHARKTIMFLGGIAHLGFIALMLLGVIMGWITPLLFIFLAGGYFASVGATIPSWVSLMGDLTSGGGRGKYFGHRNSICSAAFFVCMLAGGAILEILDKQDEKFTGFAIILAVAFLGRAGSTYLYTRFFETPYQYSRDAYFSFIDFLKRGGKSNFTRFVFFMSLMNLSIQIAAPYFTAYMLNDLDFSYLQFTAATSLLWVAMILATRQWGIVADRYGTRVILKITACMLVLMPLLFFVSRNFYYILVVQFIAGITWSGWFLSTLNFMMDAVSTLKRARCSAYMNFTNSMGVFTGAMIGALLSSRAGNIVEAVAPRLNLFSPLYLVFLISSVAGFIVVVTFLRRFHEVRDVQVADYSELLMTLLFVKPFTGARFRILPRRGIRGNHGNNKASG